MKPQPTRFEPEDHDPAGNHGVVEAELDLNGSGTVVRVGSTVRRESGVWTSAVQALLRYLNSVGFACAPVPLGVDYVGREVVSYIEGDHGAACWERVATDDGLRRFGVLLREYHTAVGAYRPPTDARWRLPALDDGPDTLVCHGDFAPWNIVWHGDEPVGIIDWEFARPRHRFDDLAWAAIWSVPLRSDEEAVTGWACWAKPPDRRWRLQVLIDAYGDGTPSDVLDRAIAVLRETFNDVTALAEQGYEPQRTWIRSGTANADLNRADWIHENRQHLW